MLVAFGFANLVALGWLAAAAAPILIHLWMRQTRRETSWAAIRFLQKALERQARKLRLQHLILMAVRTAILVLVALAAAKPFFDSGPLAGAGTATHRVLVFDTSLSMNAVNAGGEATRLESARRIAREMVARASGGDVFSVVAMGAEPTTLLGTPAVAGSAVERAIDRVTPTHAAADVGRALSHVATLLEQTAGPSSVGRRRVVVFLSDLDERGWTTVTRSEGDGARDVFDALAEAAAVTAIDVGDATAANAAVTRVSLDDAAPTSGRPTIVSAEAVLHGGERRETVAQLMVDGQQAAERRVTLAPGRVTPIEFAHTFASPGRHAVSVKLDGDALVADDRGWLAIDLRQRVRVLCVAGARGSASYLVDALDPLADGGDDTSPYEPMVISDADLGSVELGDFDCVFFSNVTELSRDEAARLGRYLESGGGAVFFLGDRVDADRYNDVLGGGASDPLSLRATPSFRPGAVEARFAQFGAERDPRLLRFGIGESVSSASSGVDPLDYAHPIAEPFRGRERAGLLTTPVTRYFELRVADAGSEGSAPVVALALGNGAPLVVTDDVGAGRIAVVATAASLASIDPATGEPWTALPAWPSFLPVVRGLVQYVTAGAVGGEPLIAGQAIVGRVEAATGSSPSLRVERPDGESADAAVSLDGDWAYAATDRLGIYRVVGADDPSRVIAAAAVNADPAESSLRRVSVDGLPEALRIERAGSSESAAAIAEPASLHRWLLQAALALVLVDTALACWFGRGGGA